MCERRHSRGADLGVAKVPSREQRGLRDQSEGALPPRQELCVRREEARAAGPGALFNTF